MLSVITLTSVISAWDPWEPTPGTLVDPEPRCVAKFGTWLDNNWDEYNVCKPPGGNVFAGWLDENGTQVIPVSLRNETTRASDCAARCFSSRDWERGSKWLVAGWKQHEALAGIDSGVCSCYGEATSEMYHTVFEKNDYTNLTQCNEDFAIWIPLSCMWTSERPCIKAPGPPSGCLWTDKCCVDAKGYSGIFNGFWPPPWWVFVGCGALIICIMIVSSLMTLSLRPPRRRGDVHRPPEDPGVSGRVHRLAHRKQYIKRLKSLIKPIPETQPCKEESCCICLEGLTTEVIVVLRCDHHYHYKCMKKYVTHQIKRGVKYPRCPTCRTRIGLTDSEVSNKKSEGDDKEASETSSVGMSPGDLDAAEISESDEVEEEEEEAVVDDDQEQLHPLRNPLSTPTSNAADMYMLGIDDEVVVDDEVEGPTYSPLISAS